MKSLVLAEKPSVARDIAVFSAVTRTFPVRSKAAIISAPGHSATWSLWPTRKNMIRSSKPGICLTLPMVPKEMGARRDQTDIQTIP